MSCQLEMTNNINSLYKVRFVFKRLNPHVLCTSVTYHMIHRLLTSYIVLTCRRPYIGGLSYSRPIQGPRQLFFHEYLPSNRAVSTFNLLALFREGKLVAHLAGTTCHCVEANVTHFCDPQFKVHPVASHVNTSHHIRTKMSKFSYFLFVGGNFVASVIMKLRISHLCSFIIAHIHILWLVFY